MDQDWLVESLDLRSEHMADAFWRLCQRAYAVEAERIAARDFPPLKRSIAAIQEAGLEACGVLHQGSLIAAAELELQQKQGEQEELELQGVQEEQCATVTIASLVVSPAHFRQGLATTLLRHIIRVHEGAALQVETSALNTPALALYRQHRFQPLTERTTADGYRVVSLLRD